jgi:hypothetical protein
MSVGVSCVTEKRREPPAIGSYLTITGKHGELVSLAAGNGPYRVVETRYDSHGECHIVRLCGSLGTATILFPNKNVYPSDPPSPSNWKEIGF